MGTPFKLKSGNTSSFKNLGSSPVKQDYHEALEHHKGYKKHKKVFDKFQSQKEKGKQFVKNILKKGKDVVKVASEKGKDVVKHASKLSKGANIVALLLGSTTTATATQPGTGTHGGSKQKTYNPTTGKYE